MPELHPTPGTASPTRPRAHHARASRIQRWRQATLDRAARRAHDDLLRASTMREASRTGVREVVLVVLSVVVLAAAVGAVGLLGWATVQPKGVWGWVGVVLGWVVVVHLAPRPLRLEALLLSSDEFPATHRLVADVARMMGARPSARIAVSTDFTAYVTRTGWTLSPVVVIGLPCWAALPADQRLALVAHGLGHLRGRDTTVGLLVAHAHGLLERLATLLAPLSRDAYSDLEDLGIDVAYSNGLMNRIGTGLLRLVSLPSVLLLLVFERLAARDSQRREYLADLCAAEVAGTHATVRLVLAMSRVAGIHAVASAAVRRREDPFDALAGLSRRPPLTPVEVAEACRRARQGDIRWDDTHPRDDLRAGLLSGRPTSGTGSAAGAMDAADAELARLRPQLARALRDELLESHL